MKHNNRYLLVVATCAACLLATSSAFAADFNSPWGDNVAVEARVGGEFFGNQWLVWKRKDNGSCQTVQIGDFFGLLQATNIRGSNLHDTLIVQSAIEVHCGKTIGAPVNNGRSLEFDGRNGNDVILAGFPASAANGNEGNDIVVMNTPAAFIEGGIGNDDVESWGTGNADRLFGDHIGLGSTDGNDCLYDRSDSANILACGNGSDQLVAPFTIAPGGHGPSNCEVTNAVCCPWAHLVGDC